MSLARSCQSLSFSFGGSLVISSAMMSRQHCHSSMQIGPMGRRTVSRLSRSSVRAAARRTISLERTRLGVLGLLIKVSGFRASQFRVAQFGRLVASAIRPLLCHRDKSMILCRPIRISGSAAALRLSAGVLVDRYRFAARSCRRGRVPEARRSLRVFGRFHRLESSVGRTHCRRGSHLTSSLELIGAPVLVFLGPV